MPDGIGDPRLVPALENLSDSFDFIPQGLYTGLL